MGGVAVVEAILPATGNVFAQIWSDPEVEESLRIDCLNRWSTFIHKYANEYQTLQLREAALESISFFTNQLMDPHQSQPSSNKTPAYLRLLETLTWLLQDDEAEVREEATLIVSRGIQLPYAVSSEKALTLVYDHQVQLFAGLNANEEQIQLLIGSLIQASLYPRIVSESLQPSKTLFDKESPNLYREPLISMQLTQRALEQIQNRPNLPASALAALQAYQQESIHQVARIQKAVEEWTHMIEEGQAGATAAGKKDRSPWGISGRKPIFEVLWRLASGSSLLRPGEEGKGSYSSEFLHDASKVHPVVIEASQKSDEARLFLIE
ncbi:hypothetical protein BG015_005159 [Linnemannia schmuckeri]|uniref:Uncharacterized protein n=1 Tax=Linnemannia schmuckeri TaxID=64567 RepID=A0A9P5UXR1_9FUNG|nr:hypothetical protein BG015_005159 [Linnemannia schmuckeri]